jgi:hypothetical protein
MRLETRSGVAIGKQLKCTIKARNDTITGRYEYRICGAYFKCFASKSVRSRSLNSAMSQSVDLDVGMGVIAAEGLAWCGGLQIKSCDPTRLYNRQLRLVR